MLDARVNIFVLYRISGSVFQRFLEQIKGKYLHRYMYVGAYVHQHLISFPVYGFWNAKPAQKSDLRAVFFAHSYDGDDLCEMQMPNDQQLGASPVVQDWQKSPHKADKSRQLNNATTGE